MPFDSGIEKYINDPTSTTLETTDYPIWNIDFPGVTICPNAKVPKSKHENEYLFAFFLSLDFNKQISCSLEKQRYAMEENLRG